jgi:hypothetical protein
MAVSSVTFALNWKGAPLTVEFDVMAEKVGAVASPDTVYILSELSVKSSSQN